MSDMTDAHNQFIAESGQLLNDMSALMSAQTPGFVATPAHMEAVERAKARHANLKVMAAAFDNPSSVAPPKPLSPAQMEALNPDQRAAMARGETIDPGTVAVPAADKAAADKAAAQQAAADKADARTQSRA